MDIELELKKLLKDTNRKGWVRKVKKNLELVTFLNQKYPGILLNEQIILFDLGLQKPPQCPVCFSHISLTGVVYKKTCSTKCREMLKKQTGKKEEELSKAKSTNLKKYGVTNPQQNKEVQLKRRKTMLEKYGDIVSPRHREILALSKNKAYKTRAENLLSLYGVSNISELDFVKDKRRETFLSKYGVEHYHQSEEYKSKIEKRNIDKIQYINPEIIVDGFKNIDEYKSLCISFSCKKCNTKDILPNVTFGYRQKNFNTPCSVCGNFQRNYSNREKELLSEIEKFYNGEIVTNKKIIPPYEIDIFIPEFNLGIEYNGLFWHSETGGGKDAKYHYKKTLLARERNIRLLHIFENEYINSKQIILEKIKNIVGLSEKGVGARKITIEKISSLDGNGFLQKHHIQGSVPGSKFFGGYNETNLVSVLAYKISGDTLEITRFANDFKTYPGLFSKYLSYIQKNVNVRKIVTFADLRISYGDLYNKTGFDQEEVLGPTYYYTDYTEVYHKFNFRKKQIEKKFNVNVENKTEKELMEELGYDRIWDSGKIKFVKHI